MGEIRGYAGDAVASQATYYGTSSSVRLDSLGENWWVMSYVNISGIDIINAEPGTYRSDDTGSSGVYLSVTGCSGRSYGNYTYDSGSSDAEVTITDNGDGTRTIDFDATFEDYTTGATQVGSGTFTYRQGEVAPSDPYDYGTVTETLVASDASQQGSMGDISAYEGVATASEGYYYGNSASVRLDSEGSGWWVMSYLSVSNLDLVNAPAGLYRTSTSATYDGTEPQLYVTGCSGPNYGNYTYDSGATDVQLELVDNGDGSRTANVDAIYTSYDGLSTQTAHSTFRFVVP
jgi:hypothetical protein